jgi:hypothetical protein
MRNLMPHVPAARVSAQDATLRPTVGGRRAPVTARGRAVLDETRRRLHDSGLRPEYSSPGRIAP